MKICRPLWAEGTFLSSQQFQQQARWEAFSNDSIAQLCIRHPWGISNVLFDWDALTLGKLKTQAVRLRFADGTLIDSDVADILPPACDLRTLEGGSAIVLLALPLAHGNGGNLGQGEQAERPLRYRQEWQKVQDIYGSDSEDMAVERHALSLRFAHDNNQDYITCPLARLVRDVQGNWTQDESYIPPLLTLNAHDGLVQRLDTLLLQLRAKCQRLMAMRRESNQRMADFAVADVSLFWLLNALNSAEPVLSDFLRYPAVHPELVWRELARLAGALLTFSLEHNVSAVPPYVHESPSTVFPPLFSLLSELLEASLPSRVIALDLASLPGNRWKEKTLEKDVLAKHTVWVKPEGTASLNVPLDKETQFVAIIGQFYHPDEKSDSWRLVIKRDELEADKPRSIELMRSDLRLLPLKDK